MVYEDKLKTADPIIDRHGCKRESLIAIMQDLQSEFNYLPPEVLMHLADRLGISPSKVYSVATFYERFSMEVKGKNILCVCDGTACHVRKSMPILQALRDYLGLDEKKHTTDDGLFTLETVACLGACGLSPVITLNGEVHAKMTPEKALDLVESVRRKEEEHE